MPSTRRLRSGGAWPVADIDAWADHLPSNLRDVWPVLAAAVAGVRGSLFGGTALAIHLRHRQSFDLDYMIAAPFDVQEVADRLTAAGGDVRIRRQDQKGLLAIVGGVTVEVFRAPEQGFNPGHVRTLEAPTMVDGLAVASLPDLLASKLDLLLYRRKLRDYIDLAAIDIESPYSLEDGLLLHMARYGATPEGFELSRIISLLEDPEALEADRHFGAQREEILSHLRARAPALRRFLHHQVLAPGAGEAPDRPDTAGLTEEFRRKFIADRRGHNPPTGQDI